MIESHYFWLNIFLLAIGTICIRGSIIAISHRLVISDRLKEIFSFIPAAILPAFVAPAVFFHQGTATWLYGKERLVVLVISAGVCFILRSTLATICFGLVTLYFLSN